MPSGKVHRMDARKKGYSEKVNEMIDLPYAWLGNKHRILFHTPEQAAVIGFMIDGQRGAMGGLSHMMLDGVKDKSTKQALEMMALLFENNRGRSGKKFRVVGSG